MMQKASHGICKQERRARKVEGVVATPARAAGAFDYRRRHPALRAERARYRFQFQPAIGARYGPPPLEDSRVAEDTLLGKNKIQDRVDHDDLSSTQRAKLLYFEYGWFFKMHIAR